MVYFPDNDGPIAPPGNPMIREFERQVAIMSSDILGTPPPPPSPPLPNTRGNHRPFDPSNCPLAKETRRTLDEM